MFKNLRPIADALRNADTYTTVLMAILVEHYGTESLHWAPETIFLELYEDFGVDPPQQNKDQIVVGLNILTSDDFYRRLPYFIQACNVLAGSELVDYFDKADVGECAWGITEVALLEPADDDQEQPFAPEIQHYLGFVLQEEGILQPPAVLQAALRSTPVPRFDLKDLPSDDRSLLQAVQQIRTERTTAIERMLQENLSTLLHQLAALSPEMKDRVDKLASDMRRAG